MRFFCQFARFQAYLYGICSTGYVMYAWKDKWAKGEETRRKLKIIVPFLVLTSVAALFVCSRLTRLIVRDITYYPTTKQFGFRFYTNFFTTKENMVAPADVQVLEVKSRSQAANYVIKVDGKPKRISTQVLGEWYNKRLFFHFMDGKTLEDEPTASFMTNVKHKKTPKK